MPRLLPIFLLAIANYSFAEPVYKWVDEDGITHFSEYPPTTQTDTQAVDVRGIPSLSSQKELDQRLVDTSPGDNETSEPPVNEEAQPDAAEKDPELCEQATHHLGRINDNSRIRAKDPETGDLTYLDADQISKQKDSWQKQADIYCE